MINHRTTETSVRALSFDPTKAHPSRRYDYWLGGRDNFAADRASGDRIARTFPSIRLAAVENRRFLQRVVSYLAADAGVRDFLDLGTGIPTSPNVHEIAQAVDPAAGVVYIDHDPLVVAHARGRLTGTPEGRIAYLRADVREPETILEAPEVSAVLESGRPVGLLLVAVLHFLDDLDDPFRAVARLVEALPPGSYVAVSHATLDPLPRDVARRLRLLAAPGAGHGKFRFRRWAEITEFLGGLTVLDPGLVPVVDWHPERDPAPRATAEQTAMYGAVARRS